MRFYEITKNAVREAVEQAEPGVNENLVNAYKARRALDYLVGFNLSPLLWKKIKPGLSAGRVQSVALRLICEREAEIQKFQRLEYWTVQAEAMKESARFPARRLYAQKLLFQSVLWSLDGAPGAAGGLTQDGQGITDGLAYAPMYYLAVCARDACDLPPLPALSLFGDAAESVYAEYRAEVRRNRAAAAHKDAVCLFHGLSPMRSP